MTNSLADNKFTDVALTAIGKALVNKPIVELRIGERQGEKLGSWFLAHLLCFPGVSREGAMSIMAALASNKVAVNIRVIGALSCLIFLTDNLSKKAPFHADVSNAALAILRRSSTILQFYLGIFSLFL